MTKENSLRLAKHFEKLGKTEELENLKASYEKSFGEPLVSEKEDKKSKKSK